MFAVVVTFHIHKDRLSDFIPLMLQNARASVEQEPECHRFDVCSDPGRPGEVFLYELYSDEAGFDAHRTTEHFLRFDRAIDGMVASKDVRTFTEVAT